MRVFIGVFSSIAIFIAVVIFGLSNIRMLHALQERIEEIRTSQGSLDMISLLASEAQLNTNMYINLGNDDFASRATHSLEQAASMVASAMYAGYNNFGKETGARFISHIDETRKAVSELDTLREGVKHNDIRPGLEKLHNRVGALSALAAGSGNSATTDIIMNMWSALGNLSANAEMLANIDAPPGAEIDMGYLLYDFSQFLESVRGNLVDSHEFFALQRDFQAVANEMERLSRLWKEIFALDNEIQKQISELRDMADKYNSVYHDMRLGLSFNRSEMEQPFAIAASIGGLLLLLSISLTVRSARRAGRHAQLVAPEIAVMGEEVEWREKPRLDRNKVKGVAVTSRRRP